MKFELLRDKALAPLVLVTSVIERRQTLPILSNILIKMEKNILSLIGTDLEVEIQIDVPVESENSLPGSSTVNARKLLDICKTLPDGATLRVAQSENQIKIQSGRSRYTLQSLPSQDFPRLDEKGHWEERFKLTQSDLRRIFEKTAFSMAQQDVRYFLNGVLLEISGTELTAVATDGHRLALSHARLPEAIETARQVIVPRKAVHELTRFLEGTDSPITVEMSSSHLRFSRAGAVLITKVIDGKFPDYRAVMAQNLTQTIVADRVELYDALARTSVLANEKHRGVRLVLESGSLKVSAHNPDQEEASDEIEVEYSGDQIEIGFNVAYLMDALRAFSEKEIEVHLQDGNSGCLLRTREDETTKYLIMPMRL